MTRTRFETNLQRTVNPIEGGVLKPKVNIAQRVGRWSIRHRRAAIIGWFALVLAAFLVGGNMGVVQKDPAGQGVGESGRAAKLYEQGWPKKQGDENVQEQVLIESKSHTAHDAAFRATVSDVMARLDRDRYVGEVESPYEKHENPRISESGHAAVDQVRAPGRHAAGNGARREAGRVDRGG
jgi:putative drug exporter of the RND superfamily